MGQRPQVELPAALALLFQLDGDSPVQLLVGEPRLLAKLTTHFLGKFVNVLARLTGRYLPSLLLGSFQQLP
jgi:hypothetical protein